LPIIKFTAEKKTTILKLAEFKGIEREKLEKSLKIGGVIVNGRRIKNKNFAVKKGDKVSICIDENPPEIEFSEDWIVFKDEFLTIVNKPQGLTTQGTMCYDVNHLYYFVKQHCKSYVGLHHRLDRDTSGLILFTLKKEANKPVSEMFKNKKIEKTYIAVVNGILKKKKEIDFPIGRIPASQPAKWWTNMPNSKEAKTIVKPLKTGKKYSLIEAMPLTGRTHQIRVHLASIGHPILGDRFYNAEEKENFSLMLHCKRLRFNHPITGKKITVETDLPERFQKILEKGL